MIFEKIKFFYIAVVINFSASFVLSGFAFQDLELTHSEDTSALWKVVDSLQFSYLHIKDVDFEDVVQISWKNDSHSISRSRNSKFSLIAVSGNLLSTTLEISPFTSTDISVNALMKFEPYCDPSQFQISVLFIFQDDSKSSEVSLLRESGMSRTWERWRAQLTLRKSVASAYLYLYKKESLEEIEFPSKFVLGPATFQEHSEEFKNSNQNQQGF